MYVLWHSPESETATSEVFCRQVREVVPPITHVVLRRRKLYITMNNTRTHHATPTQGLRRLDIAWLPHQQYSIDPSLLTIMPSGASNRSVKGRPSTLVTSDYIYWSFPGIPLRGWLRSSPTASALRIQKEQQRMPFCKKYMWRCWPLIFLQGHGKSLVP